MGLSRAALYRAEHGEITKIDMLQAIAMELDTSLANLLGSGTEYIVDAAQFFDRMRQVEHDAEQIIGLFSPVSFLLTTPDYDDMLASLLHDYQDIPADKEPASSDEIDKLIAILKERKSRFQLRKPVIASIISSVDLERFLRNGLETRHDLPADVIQERRAMALREVHSIAKMLRDQPIGIQIVLANEPIPATSFQIVRQRDRSTLTISPFRLGQDPNVQVGVGQISSAPDAVHLHEQVAKRLWEGSKKGAEAADHLDSLIERFGVK
ncbi:MAG: hypothetical protein Rhims3KO_09060 [Hyphomicrobiales bacterium]